MISKSHLLWWCDNEQRKVFPLIQTAFDNMSVQEKVCRLISYIPDSTFFASSGELWFMPGGPLWLFH